MKPNIVKLLNLCITSGVELGIAKAKKYNEHPDNFELSKEIINAIEYEIYELFHFEEHETEIDFKEIIKTSERVKQGEPLKDFMNLDEIQDSIHCLADILKLKLSH